jgi:transposase
MAMAMYMCGVSVAMIADVTGKQEKTVERWIRKIAPHCSELIKQELSKRNHSFTSVYLQMDELWSYLWRKKTKVWNFAANFKGDIEKACEIFAVAIPTGYSWIRQWNQAGYEGIKSKGKRTGRRPRLSGGECQKLEELLKEKESWTTKEVRGLIKERFGIEFSEDQVVRILRHRLKMYFSKPYPMDYWRPEDAEALLENQLQLTFSLLKENGLKEEDIAIGFIDEASPQNTANTVRVWSFGKVRSVKSVRFTDIVSISILYQVFYVFECTYNPYYGCFESVFCQI